MSFKSFFVLCFVVAAAGCKKEPDLVDVLKRRQLAVEAVDRRTLTEEYNTRWLGAVTVNVAPGVHALAQLHPSAAYAIETTQGVILIDTGVEEDCRYLRESLVEVGIKLEQVRYVLLTHAHYDHVFGANRIREISGAIVCAGRGDCEVLKTGDLDALYSLFPREYPYSGATIPVDRELDDGDTIELGEVKVRVISSPGHTPGSVSYLVEKDSQKMLFAGDVIASLNFGPATYPARLAPKFRGDARDYLATVNRLLAMEPPDLLLPGHPRQQRKYQTVRMNSQSWQGLLEPARKELDQLVDRHERDGADFLDGVAKEIEPGLFYLGELDGIAVYAIQDSDGLVVINAPGGGDLSQFLETQLSVLGLKATHPSLVLLTSSVEASRSGLRSIHPIPQVFAAPSVAETLRAKGFDIVSLEQLGEKYGRALEVVSLGESLGYSFVAGSRRVLVTPNVPRLVSLVWTNRQDGKKTYSSLEPQTKELATEMNESQSFAQDYQASLQKLAAIAPDCWLPATPVFGQNANLYDDDWQAIIEENEKVFLRLNAAQPPE